MWNSLIKKWDYIYDPKEYCFTDISLLMFFFFTMALNLAWEASHIR